QYLRVQQVAQRSVPLEHRLDLLLRQTVEVVGDHDAIAKRPEAHPPGARNRHELRQRTPGLRDDDRLAGRGALDQRRKLRLGLIEIDDLVRHGAACGGTRKLTNLGHDCPPRRCRSQSAVRPTRPLRIGRLLGSIVDENQGLGMTTDDSEGGTPIGGRPAAVATHGAAASAVWPRVAVYGAGAVGCFFGAKLAEAGAPVTLIGRPAHVEAIRRDGLLFDSPGATRRIRIAADTGPESVREAGLVLFCVKTRDTDEGARALAPLLRPDAVVVSLQNGVDNVPRMREAGVDALA